MNCRNCKGKCFYSDDPCDCDNSTCGNIDGLKPTKVNGYIYANILRVGKRRIYKHPSGGYNVVKIRGQLWRFPEEVEY